MFWEWGNFWVKININSIDLHRIILVKGFAHMG